MDNEQQSLDSNKKPKKHKEIVPNPFLVDNFMNSITVQNFIMNAEILKFIGVIEDKKKYKEAIINEWATGMKKILQTMVNEYALKEDSLRKLKKEYNLDTSLENTEDLQYQGTKNLKDFMQFLKENVVNQEIGGAKNNDDFKDTDIT